MHTPRSGVALAARLGCALLMLGLLAGGAAAAPNPPTQEWTVEIDEAALTRDVAMWAAQQPLAEGARVRNPKVELRDDQIVLTGEVEAGWLVQPATLVASASVDGGRALVRIHSARIGPVDVPQPIQRQLERQLQEQLDRASTDDVVVKSLRIGDGRLIASGTRVTPVRLGYTW